MRRSIRWTLLGWYAAILTAMVGTFGGLLYAHRHRTAFEAVDTELRATSRALASFVEWEPGEGFDLEEAARYSRQLAEGGPDARYAILWDGDGRALLRFGDVPERSAVPAPGVQDREGRRESAIPGPKGSMALVGREVTSVRRELATFLRALLAVGAATLMLSLGGGWILVRKVLRPIDRMTGAAERISAANQSERIDVGLTESELGRLAGTLNGAFDRLQAAFDRQTSFTADASHELRTPLSIVISNAECGLRQERSPEEYRESLETCLRAGQRMASIVEGLLVLARSDTAEVALDRSDVDLRSVLEETVGFLAPLAEEREVTVNLEAETIVMSADSERLRDAFGNLLSNAIRYNREGGSVDVRLAREDGRAVVTVTDTGVGIPPEDVERVFERFYRVDVARSREVGGSGLGLAITRWIVEAHGGDVGLRSESGVGTTATVQLPIEVR